MNLVVFVLFAVQIFITCITNSYLVLCAVRYNEIYPISIYYLGNNNWRHASFSLVFWIYFATFLSYL